MEQQKLSIWMCLTAVVSVFVNFPPYGDVEKVNTVQWKKAEGATKSAKT
ncbi:MAG: hypothetical protein ACYTXA_10260 [Nostoc sp.]